MWVMIIIFHDQVHVYDKYTLYDGTRVNIRYIVLEVKENVQ